MEEIAYDAPRAVRAVPGQPRGFEDVSFSPDNRRLALAGCYQNSISIADVEVAMDRGRPHVTLTNLIEFSSPCLKEPHGVAFLDDDTIVVANRLGDVNLLRLPSDAAAHQREELPPVDLRPGSGFEFLNVPGSIEVARGVDGTIEVLVANNSGDTITTQTLDSDPIGVSSSNVLLRRGMDFPDGLAVSADGAWIAVSNRDAHSVMVYQRSSSLQEDSKPNCILRGVRYPHGVCFSPDGRHLFVAGTGGPHVHVFAQDAQMWRGVQYPVVSVRVMEEDVFRQHPRFDQGDGGAKGIDLDRDGRVLAVTSVYQPLAFFDAAAILARSTGHCDHAREVTYELDVVEEHTRKVKARVHALEGSRSFRVTKPLRSLNATWSRIRH
jgi:DNA-binding beta-propeller fold protein YncE